MREKLRPTKETERLATSYNRTNTIRYHKHVETLNFSGGRVARYIIYSSRDNHTNLLVDDALSPTTFLESANH